MKVCQRNNYIPISSHDHDCARLYSFIVRVLLDAPADSPIDLALRSDNRTDIYRLRDLLWKPGLILQLRWIDINDANIEKRLTEEEYESILALDSYLNNLQNEYGPIEYGMYDIINNTTHGCFIEFTLDFDINNPIIYDEDIATVSRDRRLSNDSNAYYNHLNSTIPIQVMANDTPSDDMYPTWDEITSFEYRGEGWYTHNNNMLSRPRITLELISSLAAVYGAVGMDQLRQIVTSIGCGQLMQCPMATKYHPTLVEDAWAVVCYIREGTVNDKERVIVLIEMINDYFSQSINHVTRIWYYDILWRKLYHTSHIPHIPEHSITTSS